MFGNSESVYRDRRPQVPDQYNPDRTVPGDWANAESVELTGAFLDFQSSSLNADGARGRTDTRYTLYLSNPDADVRQGDRIRSGDLTLYVNDMPHSPRNPFTGWRPVREIPLDHTSG